MAAVVLLCRREEEEGASLQVEATEGEEDKHLLTPMPTLTRTAIESILTPGRVVLIKYSPLPTSEEHLQNPCTPAST